MKQALSALLVYHVNHLAEYKSVIVHACLVKSAEDPGQGKVCQIRCLLAM